MAAFGKLFVVINLFLSLLICTYSAAIYLGSSNWGWEGKQARKEFGEVIPSELEKRKPILAKLAREKQLALAAWQTARDKLAKTETLVVDNQLKYAAALKEIRSEDWSKKGKGGKPFTLDDLKRDKPWLFEINPKTQKPYFTFGPIANSYKQYNDELTTVVNSIDKVRNQINDKIARQKKLTDQLNGTVGATGKKEKGLYDLIAVEKSIRQRAEEELADLKPGYYEELVESDLFLKRQQQLLARIDELNALIAKGKAQE
jgi:hypothetical protein